ncbi:MAG: hypothetical protein WAL85_01790 [Candidatus Korobacteraceae bacterium]
MFWLFLRSLFSHTFTYVGAALLIAGLYATISNRVLLLAPKWFLLAGFFCLYLGGSQAWKDEHRNTESVIAQRKQTEIEKNVLQAQLDLKDRQLAYLRAHQTADSERKLQESAEITRLMSEGNSLMEECLIRSRNDADLADRANRWEAEADGALAAFDPSLAARFKTSVGTPYTHPPVNGANEAVWNFVNRRVQALASIQQDLNNPAG